jgi:hypothetical protein
MIRLQGTNCRVLVLSVVAGAPKGNVLGAQVPCTVLTGLLYVIGNLSLEIRRQSLQDCFLA